MQRMTTSRDYPRAPIIEAIIDFQVELPEDVELSDLEGCQDPAYPGKMPINLVVEHPGEACPPATTLPPVGFRFVSDDEKQVFEARFRGFSLHRLAPYRGWERFRKEARRLWRIYCQAARPRKVTRVAVRFLNRLDLPSPVVEMKDYLRTSPEVSPDLPQGLAWFLMELNIPQEDIKSTILLRERVVPPAAPGVASILLDIDLFRSEDIPSDEKKLWAFIQTLHTRKNESFEACITDRTREVIQ